MYESLKPEYLSPSRILREGLAGHISMHEILTNQIHFEKYSNTLASVCKTNTSAVLRLFQQAVNYKY